MMARAIATLGHLGYLRPAPGTWGSLAALPLAWALYQLGGLWLFAGAVIAAGAAGLWATGEIIARTGRSDPSEVVIDEVFGQWIALAPVMIGAAHVGADLLALWPGWIAAFAGFRLLDIWKPWVIGWADRRGDALGVMLDDGLAGLGAAIIVVALAGLSHGVLMG